MRAMMLAAGRGERLRPLTDTTPKALIEVAGRPLVLHTIERLRAAGITDLVL
ncbi:MAG TPA: sugar phosphate nucleotidyltransferase, partial [Gammaproteobacteria bacterium]|nr:sugar phosphate nucleotidyltransferase [Gammaproteobacteria bacterium]